MECPSINKPCKNVSPIRLGFRPRRTDFRSQLVSVTASVLLATAVICTMRSGRLSDSEIAIGSEIVDPTMPRITEFPVIGSGASFIAPRSGDEYRRWSTRQFRKLTATKMPIAEPSRLTIGADAIMPIKIQQQPVRARVLPLAVVSTRCLPAVFSPSFTG